ncbi:MAG TPA: hypothetical protein VE733_04270 [Streptosporangiaceae bacterium]|jgi:hypothetical protein|nr:hypothetical protein [Streptosporangiaceae bacterium]
MEQGCQERPIARGEPHPFVAELAFQHRDLVVQGEYLDVFIPIAIGSRRSKAKALVTPR